METLLWLLVPAVLLTSGISGIFGMGGGMLLMGLYGSLLPVATAMALHGATQLAANGFRAWLLRGDVRVAVVRPYLAGAAATLLVLGPLGIVVPRGVLFLLLGLLPFAAVFSSRLRGLEVTRPRTAATCGVLVTACHLTAGVSGPLLDLFFIDAPLPPRAVVATKAITQAMGHLMKVVLFGLLIAPDLGEASNLPPATVLVPVVTAAFLGTALGKRVLADIDERRFRRASRAIVLAMGAAFLVKAALELAA